MHHIARTQESFLRYVREAMFAEDWARQPFFLQSLNTTLKLLGLLAALITISLVHKHLLLAALAVAALAQALLSGIGMRGLRHPVWWAGPLLAALIALPAIFSPFHPGEAVTVILHRPYLAITRPGLEVASRLALRVTASVWWVGALLLSSRWDRILASLRSLKAPSVFVLSLAMAYRYLFVLVRIGEKSLFARRSRTIAPPSAKTERALMGAKVADLFRHSLALSEKVHGAMLARGFTGEYRTLGEAPMKIMNVVWLAATILGCVLVIVAQYSG